MKRLAIFVGALVLSTTTFAQKATSENPFSLEGSINLNTGNGLAWQSPTIRARYFINDNIAARVELGIGDGLGTPMSESYSFNEPLGSGSGTLEINRMSWNAQVGAEYHLSGTDRMSPYFALGVNFGTGSATGETVDSDGTAYVMGLNTSQEGKNSMFGAALAAGMDFYVFENIYVGVELGIGFAKYTAGEVTTTVEIGGVSTSTVDPSSSSSYMRTGAGNAAVRLGWRF